MMAEPEPSLPPPAAHEANRTPTVSSEEARNEAVVSKFASMLSAKADNPSTLAQSSVKEAIGCLSTLVSGHDVVCTLPSLDMHSAEDSSPLPEVGVHRQKSAVPEMKASIFDKTDNASGARKEDRAAQLLGTLTSWTKSSLAYAPDAITKNITASFKSLVDSRVRAWTMLMLKNSLNANDGLSRSRLMGMLSCTVQAKSTTVSFTPLPLPDGARGHPKDADVVLPLLFQVEMQLGIRDSVETVSFQAPGTISGDFSRDGAAPGLTRIEIRFDCSALLESMVEQARLVVSRVVARVTTTAESPLPSRKTAASVMNPSTASVLSGTFNSALNLSEEAAAQSPRLQKARTSALRLSSILEEKTTLGRRLENSRKHRSVTFENPLQTPATDTKANAHAAKRQRTAQSKGRLRSMKSFGRAHAQHGNEPRNATFGDFGRSPLAAGPVWGRDGRLKNHPVPGGGIAAADLGLFQEAENPQNATFDLMGSVGQTSAAAKTPPRRGGTGSIPRTATAVESWLVNATKSGAGKGMM